MRAVFGFVGILMVLAIGYFIYSTQIQSGPSGIPLPQQTSFVAIRQDLLSLGRSEGLYMAEKLRHRQHHSGWQSLGI
jgi:hypothetical protein